MIAYLSLNFNQVLIIVYFQKYCNGVDGLCDKMKKLNGSELLKHIKDSKFLGITNEKIYFDPNGDPPGRYVILNVQKQIINQTTVQYIYKEVGSWNNDFKLNLTLDAIKFPNNSKDFKSVCSEGCSFGYVKQIKQGGLKCCWNCKKCDDHAYVLDEFTCQECDWGYWPNKNLTRESTLLLVISH